MRFGFEDVEHDSDTGIDVAAERQSATGHTEQSDANADSHSNADANS